MSTRSTTNFCYGPPPGKADAKVYRHPDGYPEAMLSDLVKFFETVEKETNDPRYSDPTYIAAKWVVFLARMFSAPTTWSPDKVEGSLDFLSVGICIEDPGDIEWTYWVDSSDIGEDGRPTVYMQDVCNEDASWKRAELPAIS